MRKVKAYKKLSLRKRRKLEYEAEVERIKDETHCRFGFDMGSPCRHFGFNAVCKIDTGICDLETEKGKKFLREYEGMNEDGSYGFE